jgi:hypothetical protein
MLFTPISACLIIKLNHYNINRLAQNGAPTQSLKAAYNQLLKAAQAGNEAALKKAIQVAIEEKSRYAAERIMRTEGKRAWADGFFAEIADDPYVNCVKWHLSSRHPVFDICDLYAKANMFGLGAGVYPKTKVPPLPAHPHCGCNLTRKLLTEFKPEDNIREAGDKWLQKLTEDERRKVLGVEGSEAWQKQKTDWREYMRGWQGLTDPETRLAGAMRLNLLPPTDNFLATLAKERGLPYTVGKEGVERFYADNNRALLPPNRGFVGYPQEYTLAAGDYIIVDRYGRSTGKFVSPDGTEFSARSLPRAANKDDYHRYLVIKDLRVLKGETAPWFGEKGGGIQYELPDSVQNLLDYLTEV